MYRLHLLCLVTTLFQEQDPRYAATAWDETVSIVGVTATPSSFLAGSSMAVALKQLNLRTVPICDVEPNFHELDYVSGLLIRLERLRRVA
jgi:hypothetical protein